MYKQIFLMFFGILFLAILNFHLGNDYYWHVKAGEYIVNNLTIPYHDIFSWYGISNNLYWVSHEWLSEVLLYLYNLVFRNLGPLLFNITFYGGLIFCLLKFNKENFLKNKIFTLFWLLLGFLTFTSSMLPRPHMISYLLLAITLYLLYDNFNHRDSKKIYFLPLISLLWVNFHGGSSNLPYLLCLIFLIAGLFSFKLGQLEARKIDKKQLKKYLICFILCILVLVINPHGLKMLYYPYINMQDAVMISNISEWQSPSLNDFSNLGSFILIGAIIITMIITKKKIPLIDFLILGVFLILAFKSIRFLPLLYIVATFSIFNLVSKYDFEFHKNLIRFIFVLLVIISISFIPKLVNTYQEKPIPDSLINYIKEKKPKRLFNYYDYGGYLIYNDIKVFIDGRADMYSGHTLKDTFDLQNYGYEYILDKYDFDMLIIPSNIPLNRHLIANKDYKLIKKANNVLLYEKNV